jgi:hypothetical protein
MANIPVHIDPRSTRKREVTVVVHVDGEVYTTETYHIEEFAIPSCVADACVQLEDPDIDRAIEGARENGEPLPPGY